MFMAAKIMMQINILSCWLARESEKWLYRCTCPGIMLFHSPRWTLAPVSICRAKGRVKVWIENNCTINLILSGLVWLDYGKISLSVKQVFWRLGLWRGTNYWSWRLGSAKDQPFQRAIGNLDGKTYKRWAGLCGQYVLHRRVQWAMDTNKSTQRGRYYNAGLARGILQNMVCAY